MKSVFMLALLGSVLFVESQAQAWTTTQEAGNRLGAIQVKEISFEKNSSGLSNEQKNEIRQAVTEAAQKGKIDEVKVLTWSDKEYPSVKGKQNKQDIALAKHRARDLKTFLNVDLKISDVDTYNMTQRPNALEKMFHTADAKVKNTTEAAGAAPTDGNTGFFDMKAQASKGVVMIFMKK